MSASYTKTVSTSNLQPSTTTETSLPTTLISQTTSHYGSTPTVVAETNIAGSSVMSASYTKTVSTSNLQPSTTTEASLPTTLISQTTSHYGSTPTVVAETNIVGSSVMSASYTKTVSTSNLQPSTTTETSLPTTLVSETTSRYGSTPTVVAETNIASTHTPMKTFGLIEPPTATTTPGDASTAVSSDTISLSSGSLIVTSTPTLWSQTITKTRSGEPLTTTSPAPTPNPPLPPAQIEEASQETHPTTTEIPAVVKTPGSTSTATVPRLVNSPSPRSPRIASVVPHIPEKGLPILVIVAIAVMCGLVVLVLFAVIIMGAAIERRYWLAQVKDGRKQKRGQTSERDFIVNPIYRPLNSLLGRANQDSPLNAIVGTPLVFNLFRGMNPDTLSIHSSLTRGDLQSNA